VSLTRVTADLNDDGGIGAPLSSGIDGTAVGNITLTCGSFNYNEGYGIDLTVGAGKIITLKGFYSYGNGSANTVNVTPIVTRNCPLP
jgi:hypothetical protein